MCYVTLGEAVEKIIDNALGDKVHALETASKIADDDIRVIRANHAGLQEAYDGLLEDFQQAKDKIARLERDLLKLSDVHDENVKVINLLVATVKEQQKMLEILSDVAQGKKRLRRSWWG